MSDEFTEQLDADRSKNPEPSRSDNRTDLFDGRYRILETLGRGGQGVVYLAEDVALKRRVALKVLARDLTGSGTARRRFAREAEAASRVDDPGICAVYEIGDCEGSPYIAMQFVEGVPLTQLLAAVTTASERSEFLDLAHDSSETGDRAAAKPTTDQRSAEDRRRHFVRMLTIVQTAARSIHVAHERGLVHRDIKPANIMVRKDDRPVVLDFGLAIIDDAAGASLTRTGDLIGTPSYMSPEQLGRTASSIDRRTDVWSLGVTLFEVIVGRRPFEAPTRDGLYRAILTSEPPRPSSLVAGVSRDFDIVVATSLEKDRDRRYATAKDLADDLARLLTGEPIRARPIGALSRLLRWSMRNRVVAALSASLFLALAVGLAVAIDRSRKLERAVDEAGANAEATKKEAAEKAAALEEVDRLSDISRYGRLVARAEKLWPMEPAIATDLENWIADAEALLERRKTHQEMLVRLRSRGNVVTRTESTTREERLFSRMSDRTAPEYAFDDREEQWKHDTIARLLTLADQFADPQRGLLADVRRRLEFSRTVERRTSADHAAAWRAAIDAISKSPVYQGLLIEPQLGLIPLSADPQSGLEEFLDLSTHEGPIPTRDASGRLRVDGSTGVVLVLLPAKKFLFGVQKDDPTAPGYEAECRREEGPVREVALSAFFVAKFELTQGQWFRMTGANPAHYHPGYRRDGVPTPTLAHPVENVTWTDAVRWLSRFCFSLPTEAQWMYAARGGSSTRFFTGNDIASLEGAANVADLSAKAAGAKWNAEKDWAPFRDGWAATAPVGSFRANSFGLHDVHGNVSEWCWETIGELTSPISDGEGERADDGGTAKVIRGGQFNQIAYYARAAARAFQNSDVKDLAVGLRPIRRIKRP